MSNDNPKPPSRCSFCDKEESEVQQLIAGPPGLYICDECVELCQRVLELENTDTRESGRQTGEMDMDMPLDDVSEVEETPSDSDFVVPAPAEIKERLDEYVVGQEETKKVLSVAVNSHYKRILNPHIAEDVELKKSNVLLVGPTGCGKTLLARTLANILDVPFAIGDTTTLTEAGYVGEDIENILLKLIRAADFDISRAERGIIFLDELDKLAKTMNNPSITRDVSGEGVQQGLLKILEGTVANVPPQGGRKHPEQEYIQIDTGNILFIAGGTFDGIEEIISRRVGKSLIGFKPGEEGGELNPDELGEILSHMEPEDLTEYGLIPEVVGRMPVQCVVHPLSVDHLVEILTRPKNAIIRQYRALFEMENAELEFEDDALRELAKLAKEKETGARGLRSTVENVMLDVLFELPERSDERTYTITADMVKGEEEIRPEPPTPPDSDDEEDDGGEEQELEEEPETDSSSEDGDRKERA